MAVAINTFREAVRDRVLYGVLGMALCALLLSLALGEMALDQADRVVLDLSLASTSLFAVLVSIFLGSSLLYKEIARKTLYMILPKPVARHEFLLGKYLGIVLTAAVFVALTGATQFVVVALQAGASLAGVAAVVLGALGTLGLLVWLARDRTVVLIPWSAVTFLGGLWLLSTTTVDATLVAVAVALTICETLVLTAVAMVFSAFSTPFLTGLFTFGVWLVGRSADTMATLKSKAIPEELKGLMRNLVEVWPNFHLFAPGRHTLTAELPSGAGPLAYLSSSLVYALAYSALLLGIAVVVFRRRDFM